MYLLEFFGNITAENLRLIKFINYNKVTNNHSSIYKI